LKVSLHLTIEATFLHADHTLVTDLVMLTHFNLKLSELSILAQP